MSAAAAPSARRDAARGQGVTFRGVLRSEWTKLWSLRSTRWSLLVSFVGMAGLGILVSAVQMAHWNQMSSARPRDVRPRRREPRRLASGAARDRRARRPPDHRRVLDRPDPLDVRGRAAPAARALGEGAASTRRSRSCSCWSRRSPRSWSRSRSSAAITSRRRSRARTSCAPSIGAALFLTVTGLFGLSLGALVRNTAGGIALFAGIMFVLPGITAILPQQLGRQHRSLPAAERRHRHPRDPSRSRFALGLDGVPALPRLRARRARRQRGAARAQGRLMPAARGQGSMR